MKALIDIVDDLKTAPHYNGTAGNTGENDKPMPIDYYELMVEVDGIQAAC